MKIFISGNQGPSNIITQVYYTPWYLRDASKKKSNSNSDRILIAHVIRNYKCLHLFISIQ